MYQEGMERLSLHFSGQMTTMKILYDSNNIHHACGCELWPHTTSLSMVHPSEMEFLLLSAPENKGDNSTQHLQCMLISKMVSRCSPHRLC